MVACTPGAVHVRCRPLLMRPPSQPFFPAPGVGKGLSLRRINCFFSRTMPLSVRGEDGSGPGVSVLVGVRRPRQREPVPRTTGSLPFMTGRVPGRIVSHDIGLLQPLLVPENCSDSAIGLIRAIERAARVNRRDGKFSSIFLCRLLANRMRRRKIIGFSSRTDPSEDAEPCQTRSSPAGGGGISPGAPVTVGMTRHLNITPFSAFRTATSMAGNLSAIAPSRRLYPS